MDKTVDTFVCLHRAEASFIIYLPNRQVNGLRNAGGCPRRDFSSMDKIGVIKKDLSEMIEPFIQPGYVIRRKDAEPSITGQTKLNLWNRKENKGVKRG